MFRFWRRRCLLVSRALFSERKDFISNTTFTERSGNQLLALGATCAAVGATLVACDNKAENNQVRNNIRISQLPSRDSYKYLICGGGVAAQAALRVFLEKGETNDLILISPELRGFPGASDEPKTQSDENSGISLLSRVKSVIPSVIPWSQEQTQHPEIVIGPKIVHLDTSSRLATLDNGKEITFERCLIAVGTTVSNIPLGRVVSQEARTLVSGAQSKDEMRHLDDLIHAAHNVASPYESYAAAHFTIVGGGWMAPVVGATLIEKGADVTFVFSEPSFLARYFPKYLSKDVLDRLKYRSDGGVDTLAYSTVRYVVERAPLDVPVINGSPIDQKEAEVYIGTVFDAFSIIDFRTDHVLFAPTLSPNVPIDINIKSDVNGFTVNPELSIASDIYIAGAAANVISGGHEYPHGMRWSEDHARATGVHAALNMLGARNAYEYIPTLSVDLSPINLQIHVLGDIDGSLETFGYFQRSKEREEETCGGTLESGVLFCVKAAPLRHRGAAQQLVVAGIAVWEGSVLKPIKNLPDVKKKAEDLLEIGPLNRLELEAEMDKFARESIGISLYTAAVSEQGDNDIPSVQGTARGTENEFNGSNESTGNFEHIRPQSLEEFVGESNSNVDAVKEKAVVEPAASAQSLSRTRRIANNVVWRRHRSARPVRINSNEILWVEDETIGAASPFSRGDKISKAYEDLLRRSAGKD